MMKPNTKTAAALSIAVFTIITIVAFSTVLTVESKNLLASQSAIVSLSAETAQCPMSSVQAAYGIAAALIALGVIILMIIRDKANTISPETIW